MNKTPRFSIILFQLPDNRYVLQRRTKDASYAPGKLGIFGGWIERGETARQCLIREIIEETSIDPHMLNIKKLDAFIQPSDSDFKLDRHFYLFFARIKDLNFKVFEGERAEAYDIAELKNRSDLAGSASFIFSQKLI